MSYALVEDIEECLGDPAERGRWLVLDEHEEFKGHWRVNGFGKDYKYDFADALGSYRALAPSDLESFALEAELREYKLAFFEDPMRIMDAYQHLNDPPPFSLTSDLPNTIQGMLPYQVQGFNYLKGLDGGVARWDTGTGKTAVASALVKHHQLEDSFDLCFFVVKKNNKVNTARKLRQFTGIESTIIHGNKATRHRRYQRLKERLLKGERGMVVVLNYEQFKNDFVTFEKKVARDGREYLMTELTEWGDLFFEGRDLLCIWDEMPMKLKNRSTRLYLAVCSCLYNTFAPKVNWDKRRAKWLCQYMLSATPVENDPEDWFNCLRLIDPRIYGSVPRFRDEYVASYNFHDPTRPEAWHMLDKMALTAAHIVHQVDKTDPDIAEVFPDAITEALYIDWDEGTLKLYQELQKLAKRLAADEETENLHVLSLIDLFQMLCDAPTMVLNSAAHREAYEGALETWEETDGDWATKPDPKGSEAALTFLSTMEGSLSNKDHAKLDALKGLLTEVHPEEKVCIFTKWNAAIMPILEDLLQEWGISYVRYDGTDKQRQAAQDSFQTDSGVRVFLSSDTGSDSIDLDAASVVIHYDLPWKWTTYIQRQNRVHRPTSQFSTVWYYTLLMADSVEDRILEIILLKQEYHDGLFKPIAGASASARMTKEDLHYILTGER